jgi:putative PIN family toxin of toxin-antitoxin system
MRITLDTNVLVSAFIAKHGHSANLLELALTVEVTELLLSEPILQELEDVLLRDEVRSRFSYTQQDIRKIVGTLRRSARIVSPTSKFVVIREDPKDDLILNTAYDGNAEYIVSGDSDLLKLKRFKGIRIVTPKQMMEIISRKFPELFFRF